jgi:hypothetical protein
MPYLSSGVQLIQLVERVHKKISNFMTGTEGNSYAFAGTW